MRSTALAFALSVLLLAPAATAQTAAPVTPPDTVLLHDGSLFRGTLVERTPERVVLMLATGETRTWPAAEVASAGRDASLGPPALVPEPPSPPAPPRPQAALHVRAPRRDLTLHILDTSTSVPIPGRFEPLVFDSFHPLCVAPCDTTIDAGAYTLGISRGDGGAVRAGAPVTLEGERWLSLEHEDRTGIRVGGWVLLFLGPAAGAGVMAVMEVLDAFGDRTEFWEISIPLAAGLLLCIPAAIMIATNDHNAVRVHERDPDVLPIERPDPPPTRRQDRPRAER